MSDDDPTTLDDVMQFPGEQRTDEKKWIVLYEHDYHNVAMDPEGNVGVLVDIGQTSELIRLASQVLGELSAMEVDDGEVLQEMIDALKEEHENDD